MNKRIVGLSIGSGGLIAGVVLVGWLLGAENGSLPDWIQAIGTSAALLVAAAALRQELRDRHEEREMKAWERAGLVKVAVGASGINKEHWDLKLTYTNGSSNFVHSIGFTATYTDGLFLGQDQMADLGPGEHLVREVRIPWVEDFKKIKWVLRWCDAMGNKWQRTHRNDVSRA